MSAPQFDKSEEFDRNWSGPEDLKPRVYRNQMEKDIWHSIAVENEYRLGILGKDEVAIDIGANIGAFSYLAYRMGSRSIYAFEIDPWNIEGAEQNLSGMSDGILLHNAAVVRGDKHRAVQYHYNGAWNSFGVVGPKVDSISLDEILTPHDSVRFLKIDCEGGEWPVLYTCTQLHKAQQIAGEYHLGSHITAGDAPELQNLPYAIDPRALGSFLFEQGFEVKLEKKTDTIGNFYCKRR